MHKVVELQLRDGELPRPDFALYLEPTHLAVCPTQAGPPGDAPERPTSATARPTPTAPRVSIGTALTEHARVLAQSRRPTRCSGPPRSRLGEVEDRGVYGVAVPAAPQRAPRRAARRRGGRDRGGGGGGPWPARRDADHLPRPTRDHGLGGRPFEVSPDEPGIARLRGAIRSVRHGGGNIRGARLVVRALRSSRARRARRVLLSRARKTPSRHARGVRGGSTTTSTRCARSRSSSPSTA